MTWVRVVHELDGTIKTIEHRADEPEPGGAAYTEDNMAPTFKGMDWFVCDVQDFHDDDGLFPWGTASVSNPGLARGLRAVNPDVALIATTRAEQKMRSDRTKELRTKLVDDTASLPEMREMLRIERGL